MSMFYELMMKKKGIPSRYQEVEYIESTGTQYIDTGVYLTGNSRVKIKGQKLNTSRGNRLFGVDKVNEYFRFGSSGQDKYLPGYYNVRGAIDISFTSDIFELDFNKNIITLNNVEIFNTTYNNFTCSLSALLFSVNSSTITDNFIGRIYYCQIYDNGTLVRNFIPVYDTLTNKYGMWESVQGKFYGNDGTGDFKGSIVGYTIVGSPTIVDGVVSGFSSGNYIKLTNVSEIDNQSNLEIKMKLNISSLSSQQDIICCSNFGLLIRVLTNGRLNLYMSSDGSSWNIANNLQSSNILSIDTDYFIKFIFNGSVYKLQVSTDDINYVDYIILNSSSMLYFTNSSFFNIGIFFNGVGNAFSGSIFIKDWYIKKGNKLWFNGQPS